jgi:hypothetical protein
LANSNYFVKFIFVVRIIILTFVMFFELYELLSCNNFNINALQ